MPYAIDRLVRPAALGGAAGAVLLLFCGSIPTAAAAEPGSQTQLAQAQSPAGKKPSTAQRQADPVETQLADLKKGLNITAAQQPQFDAFAQAVRQNHQEMKTLVQQTPQDAKRNAVEELRASAQLAQAEADGLKRLVPTLEALYASLSEQQKRTADRIFTAAPPPNPPQQPRRPG